VNIAIVINSNIRFVETTTPRLIDSLLSCGFNENNILLICGGSTQPSSNFESRIPTFFVNYDSIDFSGLIFLSSFESSFTHYFYIHDTTFVGPNFKNNLLALGNDGYDVIALKSSPSMNIGLYSADYLSRKRDVLESIINTDLSDESLQNWKKWGVTNEDFLSWKSSAQVTSFDVLAESADGGNPKIIGEADFYENGISRRVEHYEYLDLFKVKANWDIKPDYEIRL
jgi:hypothetical protein